MYSDHLQDLKDLNPTSINKWKQELNVSGKVAVEVKEIFFKICFKTTFYFTIKWLQSRSENVI